MAAHLSLYGRIGRALCRLEGRHVPAPMWSEAVPDATRGAPPTYYCSRCGRWPVPAPLTRIVDTQGRPIIDRRERK